MPEEGCVYEHLPPDLAQFRGQSCQFSLKLILSKLQKSFCPGLYLKSYVERHENQSQTIWNMTHLISQLTCCIGLMPFLLLFPCPLALVVVLNGLWYHSTHSQLARRVDVLCNILMCLLVNLLTNYQPQTLCLTVGAFVIWSSNPKKYSLQSSLVHVVFVQWVLAFCLWNFIQTTNNVYFLTQK